MIGPNGSGKSNLLESVELLGSLRSHRCSNDKDLISWGQDSSFIRAITSDEEKIELQFQNSGARKAYRNGKLLSRQLDLLGTIKCVGFSTFDLALVRGEPSLRRNWLDRVIQQLEPIYGDLITRFNRLLRQRNQLWRQRNDVSYSDHHALLDTFDSQMALVSTRIHRRRSRALKHLEPHALRWQKKLSKERESLELKYLPGSLLEGEEEEFIWRTLIEKQLLEQRPNEEKLGLCKVGPHRDEVCFLINGLPARKFGSAGQQRTLVLALKLAELELVRDIYNQPPLLVLDDVFAELDPMRQLLLLEAVGEDHQCLISATHINAFEGDWTKNSQLIDLHDQQKGVWELM